MQLGFHEQIQSIHQQYLVHPQFSEVEHVPSQLYYEPTLFSLSQSCLVVPYSTFEKLYSPCIDILKNPDSPYSHIAADIVLLLNGENQKAWNFKRQNLESLDIQRQLTLNTAVCMKFKKSTILYDYRLQLVKKLKVSPSTTLQYEHKFVSRILNRFHRNYYCWTYRLKLFQYLLTLEGQESLVELQRKLVKQYCQRNIHEYSGFWYLFAMLKERGQGTWKSEEMIWVDGLIDTYRNMYSEHEEGKHLYSLRKYKEWLCKYA